MRTAREWGVRPLAMLGWDGAKWTVKDRLLAMALRIHEDSLCPGCGQPKDKAFNPDTDGFYAAATVVCNGCSAREQHSHREEARQAGAKTYVVDQWPAERQLMPWSWPSPSDQTDPE